MFENGPGPEYYINPELMQTPETKLEHVMDLARQQRFDLLKNELFDGAKKINSSKKAQKFFNLLPGLGDLLMIYKTARGKEAGESLSKREYVLYSAAAVTGLTALGLLCAGEYRTALAVDTLSSGIGKADIAATVIATAAKKIAEKGPQLSHMMNSVLEWVQAKQDKHMPVVLEMINSSIGKLDLESMSADE